MSLRFVDPAQLAEWAEWKNEGDLGPSPHLTFPSKDKVNTFARRLFTQVTRQADGTVLWQL